MKTTRHVALLRGINVGKAKRISMAELRGLVEGLGYGDVRTLLNSGNVVFTASGVTGRDAAARIEKALETELEISCRVIGLDAAELDGIIEANPLSEVARDPSRFLVAVLRERADRARLKPLLQQSWSPDALALGERVAYVWCGGGILASKLYESVTRLLGDAMTARNWATMLKIQAVARGDA